MLLKWGTHTQKRFCHEIFYSTFVAQLVPATAGLKWEAGVIPALSP